MSGDGATQQTPQPTGLTPAVQPNAQGAVDLGQAQVGPNANSSTNPIGTFGLNTTASSMSWFGSKNNVVMKGPAS